MTSELVRDAIDHYHGLLDQHFASTCEELHRSLGPIPPERAGLRLALRPHFVGREEYDQILRVTELLARGVVTAARRLARDPALQQKLDVPSYLARLVELDREDPDVSLIARFDGIVDQRGVFKVIEYNTGPGYDELATAYSALPITEEFGRRYAFRTTSISQRYANALSVRDGEGERPAVVAIPVMRLADLLPPDVHRRGEARGVKFIKASVDELRHDGTRLTIDRGEPIVVDMLFAPWEEMNAWAESGNAVFEAIRAGSVRVINGVSLGLLCGYKQLFELLSNPEYASMFEPEVAAALAKHVPWTRAVRNAKTTYGNKTIDLLPFVAESRVRWVLKPSGGSSGSGVLIGDECTDSDWRQALKRALTQNYIIQERVRSDLESFPIVSADRSRFELEDRSITLDPFVWDGATPADAMVRLWTRRSSLAVHTPLWIIDGEK